MKLVVISNKDNNNKYEALDERIKAVTCNSKEANNKYAATFRYKILLFQTTIESYLVNNDKDNNRWIFYRDIIVKNINNVVYYMIYSDNLNVKDIMILTEARAKLKANLDMLKYNIDMIIILDILENEQFKTIFNLFSSIENMVGGRIKQLTNKINNLNNPDYDRLLNLNNKKNKNKKDNNVEKQYYMPSDIIEHPLWNKLSDDVKNYYIEINNIDI